MFIIVKMTHFGTYNLELDTMQETYNIVFHQILTAFRYKDRQCRIPAQLVCIVACTPARTHLTVRYFWRVFYLCGNRCFE